MYHEDADCKRREGVVAQIIEERTQTQVFANHNYAGTDFCLFSRKYERWMYAELKTRPFNWGQYPDIMIEQGKFGGVVPHLHTGVGFQYIVACLDKLAVWTALHASKVSGYRRDWNGRTDRGDPKDMKLCIYIPADDFTVIPLSDDEIKRLWRNKDEQAIREDRTFRSFK
jgi:hypothetical protein